MCVVFNSMHPVLCINTSSRPCFFFFFSHPLSSSCMCVIVCLFHPPPVFHAHLLIRISTGWEDPHSLDSSRGHRLQKVHISQWCVELRYCHVGSDVVWREAVLGHEQSRCKLMWALDGKTALNLCPDPHFCLIWHYFDSHHINFRW